MSEELKPCPFCGGESELYQYRVNEFSIRCKRCKSDCGCWKEPYKAEYVWNTRPEEERMKAENEMLKEALRQIVEIANLRFNATVATYQKNAWYEVAKIANNALANAPDMEDGRITKTNGTKRVIVEVENSDGEKVVFTVPYSEKQCSIDYETNMPEFEKK